MAGRTWELRPEGGDDKEEPALGTFRKCVPRSHPTSAQPEEREDWPHSRDINNRPPDLDSMSQAGRREMKGKS